VTPACAQTAQAGVWIPRQIAPIAGI